MGTKTNGRCYESNTNIKGETKQLGDRTMGRFDPDSQTGWTDTLTGGWTCNCPGNTQANSSPHGHYTTTDDGSPELRARGRCPPSLPTTNRAVANESRPGTAVDNGEARCWVATMSSPTSTNLLWCWCAGLSRDRATDFLQWLTVRCGKPSSASSRRISNSR